MSEELRTEQQQSLSLQRIKKTLEIQVHELAVPTNIFLLIEILVCSIWQNVLSIVFKQEN